MYVARSFAPLVLGATLVLGACASTASDSTTADVQSDVQEAVSSNGHVAVNVSDGVATLSGFVNDASVKEQAEEAATEATGVTDVVNLIMVEGDNDPTT